MKKTALIFWLLVLVSCVQSPKQYWQPYDETEEISQSVSHENSRMRYKLIQSKFLDKNALWAPFERELDRFGENKYEALKPLILEQNIPTIKGFIEAGELSYEELVTFYLYRIRLFESNPETTLHAIVALNPKVIKEARAKDKNKATAAHPIYGMPILLKDNINTSNMPTTGGAAILEHHIPEHDAFVVEQLKANGALILGKVNLSEWAYYFCDGCPLGYSAVGGQTLNPYGRKVFESGGSSAGSGVAVAANYAVAALGSETAGSILSPSSKNAVIGLKPTVGVVSRTGIIPISSTLDTSGPMTKNVIDNAILLDAMAVKDEKDSITLEAPRAVDFLSATTKASLKGVRLGAIASLMTSDSLYRLAVDAMKMAGAEIIEITPPDVSLSGFSSVLNGDMKRDLPHYFTFTSSPEYATLDTQQVIAFNSKDSTVYMPYGQARLDGVVADTISTIQLKQTIQKLHKDTTQFFATPMQKHALDAVLSKNNYHAAYAAIAFYPCITVPMGYSSGEPASVTIIAPSYEEEKLLNIAAAYEQSTKHRKLPKGYN